jgi:hypothetical protein
VTASLRCDITGAAGVGENSGVTEGPISRRR